MRWEIPIVKKWRETSLIKNSSPRYYTLLKDLISKGIEPFDSRALLSLIQESDISIRNFFQEENLCVVVE